MKRKFSGFVWDVVSYLLGAAAYSAAVIVFLKANAISPGGITGIATVINYLFSLPVGLLSFIFNIPILIIGLIKFGGIFVIKTGAATVLTSIFLDVFEALVEKPQIDLMLASIFGGILMGTGISLIMLRGGTTGGVDIIAKLINKRFPHMSVGRIMLLIDAAVIAIATLVYKNTESALYSVVALYASSRVTDIILYGADKGKVIYIISDKTQDIVYEIIEYVRRGVSIIDIKGGYSGEARKMIMCTVRRNEVSAIYGTVQRFDKSAFIVVCEAGEILGEGFKNFF